MKANYSQVQAVVVSLYAAVLLVYSPPSKGQAAFDSSVFNQSKTELTLLRITPSGEDVPVSNRQVIFKFNQPVVAIGDMQRDAKEIPISIEPALQCQWLWLDNSSLSCQLTQQNQLQAATEYTFKVNPGLETTDGAVMDNPVVHTIITERPKLRSVQLEQWTQAARPVARLHFNQPVTKSSVQKHVRLIFGSGRVMAVTASDEHNSLLDSYYRQAQSGDSFAQLPLIPAGNGDPAQLARIEQAMSARKGANDEARATWRVTPSADLPVDSRVTFDISAGIKSILGKETGLAKPKAHSFRSLPEFDFLGVRCAIAQPYETVTIEPLYVSSDELRDQQTGTKLSDGILECDPLNSVSLIFSTPVSYATAKQYLSVTPDLAGGLVDYDPWSTRYDQYQLQNFFNLRFNYGYEEPYLMPLPEYLQAYQQYGLVSAAELSDEFGRMLPSPMDMSFLTAHRAPRLWYDHRHSVLEKGVDSELPITVTNLNELQVKNYAKTTSTEFTNGLGFSRQLAEVEDIAYRVPLGVRELLGGESGVIVGRLASDPVTPDYRADGFRFMSQVTPFHVHLKLGHFNSYVWVTDMATGQPVPDAAVRLELDEYASIAPFKDQDSAVKTDRNGVAELPGILQLDPDLEWVKRYYFTDRRFMLKVAKGQDIAVLPVDNAYIARSQIWHRLQVKDAYMHAWGTTAQGIYIAGDTIQYKFYVRGQDNRHWIAPQRNGYSLEVIDPKGQVVKSVKNLTLSEFGAFAGELTTSKSAAVGWYQFKLSFQSDSETITLYPMQVLVSDFTPAPFRVSTEIGGDQFQSGDTLAVTTLAKMHAGGPYADAQARVTARLTPRKFVSSHPAAKGFNFSGVDSYATKNLHQSVAKVNQQGELTTEFVLDDYDEHFGRITIESAVRDDRGKYVASSAAADYLGRDLFVGLKNTQWVHDAGKIARVEAVVVDAQGEPVADREVNINVEYEETRAARVKSAGNAYLTQYSTQWVSVAKCALRSSLKPVDCEFTPEQAGRYRLTATINDTQQRINTASIQTWVVGDGAVVWSGANNNQLELVRDAESYRVGDVARLLVKNPYPGAQALVTVERYGVKRHRRQTLTGGTPIIEVPILSDDYPGVFVSVVVASPRVSQPLGDDNVDLGKPAFKLGYVKIPVRDNYKEIEVSMRTDKEVYKPRDTVEVKLKAKSRTGKRQPIEVAIVAIDEAVFDLNLSGKSYYDAYQGFNKLDQLGVANYNLLMRVLGRQKFEKKGASPGGGGGEAGADLRNVMKFVAYWNPSMVLDRRGRAQFEFELPDNLTGWRVFAIAVTKEERMGLGEVSFKVNRPTELRPVMPNQLTQGDQVQAGFSVMNRTNKPRTLNVELTAAGDALAEPVTKTMQLELDAYQRQRVWLPIKTSGYGELAFLAKAGDALDRDAIEHHVPVQKRRALITAASYGTTTANKVIEKVAFPEGIFTDVGGVDVVVSPSVIGNVAGAFKYLRDYPYWCWEQRLSKGLAAAQYRGLKRHLPDDLNWQESVELPIEVLNDAASFQAPNGGMTYWVNNNAYVSPYLSAYTALGFVWLREQGYAIPEEVERKLQDYLSTFLRRDDSADTAHAQSMRGMRSSVRAVALAALAAQGKISVADLKRYQRHLPEMDLFGKAHFLQAAATLGADESTLLDISQTLMSHSVQSGGKVQFNEAVVAGSEMMLSTPMRSNCAILSSLMKVSRQSEQAAKVMGDVPFKQVRAITQTRGGRDYWENTQENIFCMRALLDFSQVYERDAPSMQVDAALLSSEYGEQVIGRATFDDVRDPAITLTNPELPVEPNLQGQVSITKQGRGRMYYSVRMQYAKTERGAERINAGLEVRREYSVQRDGEWQLLASPMRLEKGELVRVDLFISVPTARHFVVIDDPVPGGLEPVNRDLATSSTLDAEQASYVAAKESWWHGQRGWTTFGRYGYSFYHQELRHDSARFFSDYLPAGHYHLSYAAQAIAGGAFSVMPLKAEEMYDPDVYGLGMPATLNVAPAE